MRFSPTLLGRNDFGKIIPAEGRVAFKLQINGEPIN